MESTDVKNIYMDPRCMINYGSYYIYGLWKTIGRNKCRFSLQPFRDTKLIDYKDYRRGFPLVINLYDETETKIYIDFSDSDKVDPFFKTWADLYAKINISNSSTEDDVFAIGPSFSITLWNGISTFVKAIVNYHKGSKLCDRDVHLKYFLRDYMYLLYRRKKFYNYLTSHSEDDYCFFLSTLWYDEVTDQTTNKYRGWFLKEAKEIFPKFEGGFFYIKNAGKEFKKYNEYIKTYDGLLINKRIPMDDYLFKIKRSSVVFNTPSVLGCHGWKLGEYLAMGKAIISTPITNKMPGNFLSGKNYIEVKTREDIHNALIYLKQHGEIRKQMEKDNKEYFDNYLSPSSVIKRIINKI